MGKYNIKQLAPKEYELWDKFVESSQEGTLFHKSFWLRTSPFNECIIGCFSGGTLIGGAALSIRTNLIGQKILKNPYLTPYSGVIYGEKRGKYTSIISREKSICNEIIDFLKTKFNNFAIRLSPNLKDIQPFIWQNFESQVKYTYLLELDDLDQVWKDMDSSKRRNIKKAKKDNLKVKKEDDFQNIEKLATMTYKREGKKKNIKRIKNYGKKFFKELQKRNSCKSFICYNTDDIPIGGVFIVWDKKKSYYLLGGYDPENSHYGASSFAMWKAIKYSADELGLQQFDFEGSMIKSVEKFFRKFGGTLTPYYKLVHRSKSNQFYQALSKLKP